MVGADAEDSEETERAPYKLKKSNCTSTLVIDTARTEKTTNSGDGFYADGEDVGGEVARVRKGVFFPKLCEEGIHARDVFAVVDVVS
jgi:hypothetical protein